MTGVAPIWVVTGGASGIGAQLVRELIDAGETVVIWDLAQPSPDISADYVAVDLSASGSVEAAAGNIKGPVRAFVHCAGVPAPTSVAHGNAAAQLRFAFEVHVISFVVAVQALADRLEEGRGSVVAVASMAMDVITPATLAYGVTKAALRRAIDQLAVELGGRGIRVNGVAPGAIATPMTNEAWANEAYARERRSFIPLSRQGQPASVSNLIRFLASDAADYITGETIFVDGGMRHGIFNLAARTFAGSS